MLVDEAREGRATHAAFPYLAPGLAALHVGTTARVEGDAVRDRLVDAALAAGAEIMAGRAELGLRGWRGRGGHGRWAADRCQ
ncbi:MAG: hypothetical protein JOZ07_11490 [Solirubrobacterales bacterium]|nr:hypothetical protein [Solirubrobacterales bacterium]